MSRDSETSVAVRRTELGMTQAEAAAKAGVSLATWRRFEQTPELGYRGDTIRGVLRALKLSREELAALLGGQDPTIAGRSEAKDWTVAWNRLWQASNWPSFTPRMAAAIQSSLDMARDMLEGSLGDSSFDPEDWPVLAELDPRVFIEVGENKAWFRAVIRRLDHLVAAMNKGQLIDESCESFADAVLFGAAVRHTADTWDDAADAWPDLTDAPTVGDEESSCDRWDDFLEDLDDRMPYREWNCAFAEYRRTRHLLNHRPPRTWFDEPDEELEGFRSLAASNVLAQELMSPSPSRESLG